ncbi:MAG: tetratricopeptide repeat protein [Bacteroidia bacterium]|nr:tetratricopeptide repeat protein [Bacteroidia bacterium]
MAKSSTVTTSSPASKPVHARSFTVFSLLPTTQTKILGLHPFWFFSTLLTLIAILININTLNNKYALDDFMVIQNNKYTQKGFAGIKDLLTKDSMWGFSGENPNSKSRYFRPLSYITFAIEIGIWGKDKPGISHFINTLLYGATVFVLYAVLSLFFFRSNWELAFGAALIYAVHPIHTEAVANLKGRDEMLSFFFILLTLFITFFSIKKNKPFLILLSGITYVLALLSKENGLMFLAILPITLYTFLPELTLKKIGRYLGIFLVFFSAYMMYRIGVVGSGVITKDTNPNILNNMYLLSDFEQKYTTITYVLGKYIQWLFFPHPLACDHSYNQIPYQSFQSIFFWIYFLIQLASVAWALWQLPKRHPVAWAILFYHLSVFIISSLVVDIGGFVAERFLYQASMGFAVAIAYGVDHAIQKLAWQPATRKKVLLAAAILVAFPASIKTIQRNKDWHDNTTLFLRDIEAAPRCVRMNKGAGSALIERSLAEKDTVKKKQMLAQSLAYLKKALRIDSSFAWAWSDLGSAYYLSGDLEKAEQSWLIARGIDSTIPLIPTQNRILADEYSKKAIATANNKNYQQAIAYVDRSLKYYPQNDGAWCNKGVYHNFLGQNREAINSFRKAIEIRPDFAMYWYNLGGAYYQGGLLDSAYWAWQNTLKLDSTHKDAKMGLQLLRNKGLY